MLSNTRNRAEFKKNGPELSPKHAHVISEGDGAKSGEYGGENHVNIPLTVYRFLMI